MRSACASDTHGHRPSAMRRTFIFCWIMCVTRLWWGEAVGAAQNWNKGIRCRTIPLVHVIFGKCGIPVRTLNQNFITRTFVPLASAKLQWRRRKVSSGRLLCLEEQFEQGAGAEAPQLRERLALPSSILLALDTVSQAGGRRGGAREHTTVTTILLHVEKLFAPAYKMARTELAEKHSFTIEEVMWKHPFILGTTCHHVPRGTWALGAARARLARGICDGAATGCP